MAKAAALNSGTIYSVILLLEAASGAIASDPFPLVEAAGRSRHLIPAVL